MFDRRTFWNTVCDSLKTWRILLTIDIILLLLLGLSYPSLTRGTASWVLATTTGALLLATGVLVAVTIRVCGRWEMADRE